LTKSDQRLKNMKIFKIRKNDSWHIYRPNGEAYCRAMVKRDLTEAEYSLIAHGRHLCGVCVARAYNKGIIEVSPSKAKLSEKYGKQKKT
jgi:hypothetical protein